MKDIIVEETVGEMDKDSDGFISVEEYIGEGFMDGVRVWDKVRV